MTDITEQNTSPNTEAKAKGDAWWQRPVLGEGGLVGALLGKNKEEISENVMMLHNREMMDVNVFAKTAQAIDTDKFLNPEFLQFVRIKHALAKGLDEYWGLDRSVQFLQVAIEAKDSFLSIDQTELRYRGSKQQDFYQYVESQLKDVEDKSVFREHITEYLDELIPQVKTEEGKNALNSYAEHLDRLSEHQLGLKLLSLFKTYQLADYSILRIISDMIQGLSQSDLSNFKALVSLVTVNYKVFEKLRDIIGVSAARHKPETYALMIQYIALCYRHGLSYIKFNELLTLLKKWYKPYNALLEIRNSHPATQYKQPKEFTEPIPGIAIYEKYMKALTDPRTGVVYMDLSE